MALNSVCWHLCISKTKTQMSEQQKEQAKTGNRKEQTPAPLFEHMDRMIF